MSAGSTFVFGQFSYSGLGDASWFAASCVNRPGVLVAPSLLGRPVWPAVVNDVTAAPLLDADGFSVDRINTLIEPNSCVIATLLDVSDILGSYAFCDNNNNGESTDGMGGGEVLICNRPLNPLIVSCDDKPLLGRVDNSVGETLKVEHYTSMPEFAFNEITGSYPLFGPSTTPPSGFYSFEGGCEVFVGEDITCFGGNGIFAALPFGHRCSGDLDDLTQVTCGIDALPLDCSVDVVATMLSSADNVSSIDPSNEDPNDNDSASSAASWIDVFSRSGMLAICGVALFLS